MWNTSVQKYTSHRSDSQYRCRYSRKKTWHPTATAKHRQQRYRSIAENCHSFNSTEICLGNELCQSFNSTCWFLDFILDLQFLWQSLLWHSPLTWIWFKNLFLEGIISTGWRVAAIHRSCSNSNNSSNNRNCISSDSTVQGVILWHSLFTGIQSKNIYTEWYEFSHVCFWI